MTPDLNNWKFQFGIKNTSPKYGEKAINGMKSINMTTKILCLNIIMQYLKGLIKTENFHTGRKISKVFESVIIT